MKRYLNRKGKSEVSKCKTRIQGLLRELAIIRDKGCVLAPYQGKDGIPYCNGYRRDGGLILQYDHLNSRAHNVSFAELKLGVIVCKAHHGWKGFTDNNKKLYDILIRKIIGKERAKLWDRCEADTKAYPMGEWEWAKVEIDLTQRLKAELAKLKI